MDTSHLLWCMIFVAHMVFHADCKHGILQDCMKLKTHMVFSLIEMSSDIYKIQTTKFSTHFLQRGKR